MQTQLNAKKNDLKSGAFRDASMAMCALVAAADGSVDPSERRKVAQLIGSNEVLQNFPALDLQRPEAEQTHLGRLVRSTFGRGGGDGLLTVIERKVNANLTVLQSSTWTWAIPLALVLVVLMTWRRPKVFDGHLPETTAAPVLVAERSVAWDRAAEDELKKIPFFVRGKARRNTERFALERSVATITVETLYDAKAHFGR